MKQLKTVRNDRVRHLERVLGVLSGLAQNPDVSTRDLVQVVSRIQGVTKELEDIALTVADEGRYREVVAERDAYIRELERNLQAALRSRDEEIIKRENAEYLLQNAQSPEVTHLGQFMERRGGSEAQQA